MREAVIVDAVRTPVGRRGGVLAGVHPADLLGHVLSRLVERTGIDPELVDDVIAGCVGQVGEQSVNVARNAWLGAGLPESVPATTVDRPTWATRTRSGRGCSPATPTAAWSGRGSPRRSSRPAGV